LSKDKIWRELGLSLASGTDMTATTLVKQCSFLDQATSAKQQRLYLQICFKPDSLPRI